MRTSLLTAAALATAVNSAAVYTSLEPRQSATKLTVTASTKYQVMDGFGFSEAFQRANNIVNLNEPLRSQLVDLLFNATSGAGFTIVRNGIGSSPNSNQDFMNSIEPNSPGSPSGTPKYVWDGKDSGQLWVSQQAVKYGVKTFYADAWSAPGYMKSNGNENNGGNLCGVTGASCNGQDWRQAFANYLVQYVNYYAQSGVNVTHLGFLNEPDYSASYASMQSTGQQAADFIKVLYPTLQSSGHGDIKIACCDATGYNAQVTLTNGLNSAGAGDMVGVITQHTYTSQITGTQPTKAHVWETECSDLNGAWSTAWYTNGASGDGLTWANAIYQGLTAGNLNGYLWWVATQDPNTNGDKNEKLVKVDTTKQTYEVSKRLWAFAQYSRTIRPGATRVAVSNGNNSNLKVTAFLNADGSTAVNIINGGGSAVPISIGGVSGASSAKAWTTDNSNDMTLQSGVTVASDGTVSGASVPAHGMLSYVIKPPAPVVTSSAVPSGTSAPVVSNTTVAAVTSSAA